MVRDLKKKVGNVDALPPDTPTITNSSSSSNSISSSNMSDGNNNNNTTNQSSNGTGDPTTSKGCNSIEHIEKNDKIEVHSNSIDSNKNNLLVNSRNIGSNNDTDTESESEDIDESSPLGKWKKQYNELQWRNKWIELQVRDLQLGSYVNDQSFQKLQRLKQKVTILPPPPPPPTSTKEQDPDDQAVRISGFSTSKKPRKIVKRGIPHLTLPQLQNEIDNHPLNLLNNELYCKLRKQPNINNQNNNHQANTTPPKQQQPQLFIPKISNKYQRKYIDLETDERFQNTDDPSADQEINVVDLIVPPKPKLVAVSPPATTVSNTTTPPINNSTISAPNTPTKQKQKKEKEVKEKPIKDSTKEKKEKQPGKKQPKEKKKDQKQTADETNNNGVVNTPTKKQKSGKSSIESQISPLSPTQQQLVPLSPGVSTPIQSTLQSPSSPLVSSILSTTQSPKSPSTHIKKSNSSILTDKSTPPLRKSTPLKSTRLKQKRKQQETVSHDEEFESDSSVSSISTDRSFSSISSEEEEEKNTPKKRGRGAVGGAPLSRSNTSTPRSRRDDSGDIIFATDLNITIPVIQYAEIVTPEWRDVTQNTTAKDLTLPSPLLLSNVIEFKNNNENNQNNNETVTDTTTTTTTTTNNNNNNQNNTTKKEEPLSKFTQIEENNHVNGKDQQEEEESSDDEMETDDEQIAKRHVPYDLKEKQRYHDYIESGRKKSDRKEFPLTEHDVLPSYKLMYKGFKLLGHSWNGSLEPEPADRRGHHRHHHRHHHHHHRQEESEEEEEDSDIDQEADNRPRTVRRKSLTHSSPSLSLKRQRSVHNTPTLMGSKKLSKSSNSLPSTPYKSGRGRGGTRGHSRKRIKSEDEDDEYMEDDSDEVDKVPVKGWWEDESFVWSMEPLFIDNTQPLQQPQPLVLENGTQELQQQNDQQQQQKLPPTPDQPPKPTLLLRLKRTRSVEFTQSQLASTNNNNIPQQDTTNENQVIKESNNNNNEEGDTTDGLNGVHNHMNGNVHSDILDNIFLKFKSNELINDHNSIGNKSDLDNKSGGS